MPPPSPDTLHRKLGGVMVNTNIHETLIGNHVIHPVRDGFAIGEGHKVVDGDFSMFPFGLPLSPVVLELPD